MVTGKNKEQFEKWYYHKYKKEQNKKGFLIPSKLDEQSPFECRIGVYLAYYDSKGIFVDSEKFYDLVIEDLTDDWESGFWYKKGYHVTKDYFVTRNEAYKEAFKQADKLINDLWN